MSSLQFLGQELPGVYDTTLAGTVSTTYLYHEDALGSVRAVTAANGSLTGDGMYYPWGEEWKKTGNAVAMFGGFEGADSVWQEQYVAVHRVYQPNYGRWLTPDPGGIKVVNLADPQTWNMYAYVTDNPTTLNDPTGLGAHCTGQNTEHNNVLTCEQAQAAAQLTATLKNSTQERPQQQIGPDYIPSGGSETLAVTAGRINNETNGMKNSKSENMSLSDAEKLMAHQRFNAERRYGKNVQNRAGMMAPLMHGPGYKRALAATIAAAREDATGYDPTLGANHYNMRTPAEANGMHPFYGYGVHTVSGPYISPGPYKYIVTYGPPIYADPALPDPGGG